MPQVSGDKTHGPLSTPAPEGLADAAFRDVKEEAQLARLMETFEHHGGLLRCDQMVHLMRKFGDQPMSRLARWIASREIVTVTRHCALFVPMFQFDSCVMEPQPRCRDTVLELGGAMVDEEVAVWFASPNSWLGGALPVEMLERDPDCVVEAARADRFVRRGW